MPELRLRKTATYENKSENDDDSKDLKDKE